MPNKLLLVLLLLSSFKLPAQRSSFDPTTSPAYYSNPTKFTINNRSLPFNDVIVIDRRFDTSKLGYAKTAPSLLSMLKTKKSFTTTIHGAITKSVGEKFNTDTGKKLVIVIRHLWLDGLAPDESYKSSYTAGLDVYINSMGNYIPLFKIDTFVTDAKPLLKHDEELILAPFKLCFEKLESFPLEETIAKRRKLGEAEIQNYYQSKFEKTVLKNDSLAKGVYLTFENFIQQKPAYTEFKIAGSELSDDLFAIQNGNEILLDKYWGVSDGHNNYIRVGHNLFLLHRQNNTYDLMGLRDIKHPGLIPGNSVPVNAPVLVAGEIFNSIKSTVPDKLVLKPAQLNMETGKPYGY